MSNLFIESSTASLWCDGIMLTPPVRQWMYCVDCDIYDWHRVAWEPDTSSHIEHLACGRHEVIRPAEEAQK